METQALAFANSPYIPVATGIYLLTGLTWFDVFGKAAPLYMAGLAFTAYGIHWFAMAHRRYIDSSARIVGLLQFVTGIWLMYCTYAITVNLAPGAKAWV
jgi:hypothetical protein